jgi:sugar phosphate isomerase/epimerase
MIKCAVTIASDTAKESAFVVWRGFDESIRKAADLGYDGIELALKTSGDIDSSRLDKLLQRYDMEVSAISTGQVFADLGLYFTSQDPDICEESVRVFSDLVVMAGHFGKKINIGRTRGFVAPGQTREDAEKRFADTIKRICEVADRHDVQIIIEPVNRYEINFINNLDEGSALLSRLDMKNCGLMPDLFHMNIEDDKLDDSIIRNGKWIKYIHFADSNRLAPGWGHLDFDQVFDALKVISYEGWVSVEILPEPEPDQAAGQAISCLRPKIDQYNKLALAGTITKE